MFDICTIETGRNTMREDLRTESSKGMAIRGITLSQKVFSTSVALIIAALLVIIPNLIL